MNRDEAIKRIRAGLKRRSGKAWSVKGGRGTAWGWIKVDAPPARCTWESFEVETGTDGNGERYPRYDWRDTGKPGHHAGPADNRELAELFGLSAVHFQGLSIPASTAYYQEHVDRAEGREASVIGRPYWD